MNMKWGHILIAGSLLASCSSGDVIVHHTVAEKGAADTDSEFCAVHVEALNPSTWKHLLGSKIYMKKEPEGKVARVPQLPFFQIIIKNISPQPLRIEKIYLIYGNTLTEPVTGMEFRSRYRSTAYEPIDFQSLFSYRRLTAEKLSVKDIDYDRDTAAFVSEWIPPGDTVLKVLAFDWIPVQYRSFILRLTVAGAASKKIIDLKLIKSEYRPRDKFFPQPEKKERK